MIITYRTSLSGLIYNNSNSYDDYTYNNNIYRSSVSGLIYTNTNLFNEYTYNNNIYT